MIGSHYLYNIPIEIIMPTEEQIRISRLKCWKRWMIHGEMNYWDGWWILFCTESIAAGW